MKVTFSEDEKTITAHLEGEIDHHCVVLLREKIDKIIDFKRPEKIVLDMAGVNFTDSSGIAVVMGRYKIMKSIGGSVEVINSNKIVRKVLSFGALEKLIKIS